MLYTVGGSVFVPSPLTDPSSLAPLPCPASVQITVAYSITSSLLSPYSPEHAVLGHTESMLFHKVREKISLYKL
jgi:hypothetical protein